MTASDALQYYDRGVPAYPALAATFQISPRLLQRPKVVQVEDGVDEVQAHLGMRGLGDGERLSMCLWP